MNTSIRSMLFVIVAACMLYGAEGGLIFNVLDTPWTDVNQNSWDVTPDKTIQLKNRSDLPWVIEGTRVTIPNAPGTIEKSYMDAGMIQGVNALTPDEFIDEDRWQIHLGGGNNINTLSPHSDINIKIFGKGVLDGSDWTPRKPYHWLIKTGSFGNDKGFHDIDSISVDWIDSIIAQPQFYDPDHYVRDTLGQRGGKWSGGFIDTWMEQDSANPVPVTQLQMNFLEEDTYIEMNGHPAKFRPDLMGTHQSPDGAGPMYAMSLAMAQEYMHLDYQMLAAIGSHESMAALEVFERLGSGVGDSQGLFYGQEGGSMEGNTGKNGGEQLGTMHYITTSYRAYGYGAYPKFYPYDEMGGDPREFFKFPAAKDAGESLGYCAGNSATIVSTTLINTLYCWYGFELLFNSTGVDYRKVMEEAKDSEIAAKLFMWSWNKGWGSGFAGLLYNSTLQDILDDEDIIDRCPDYVHKVYQTLPKLLDANKNSKLNNGTTDVYDTTISKEQLAEFFFGVNREFDGTVNGTSLELARNGNLGVQGLLQHFRLDQDERKTLWADLETAYDKMKGKAPSTQGTDLVSLRYDFLTLLRVVKGRINLDTPMPNTLEFETWVEDHSKEDNIEDVDTKDSQYPFYQVDYSTFGFNADGDFFVEIEGRDNGYFDDPESQQVIEWTIDTMWEDWRSGEVLSLDTIVSGDDTASRGRFRVVIPHADYVDEFGNTFPGFGWIRISDKNRNSTVQEFVIPGIKYPRFRNAYMRDLTGDGYGDSLVVKLVPAEDDVHYDLDGYESLEYSWPDQSSFKNAANADAVTVSEQDSLLAVIDSALSGGAGTGRVEFIYPLDKAEYKIDTVMSSFGGDVADSVGPALQKAVVTIGDDRDRDTLSVELSEELGKAFSTGDSWMIFSDGSEQFFTAEAFSQEGPRKWTAVFPKNSITSMDSVKLRFEDTYVEDKVGNGPVAYNQWVPLSKLGGIEPKLTQAVMTDQDGDGLGDQLAVSLELGTDPDAYTVNDITGGSFSWPGTALDQTIDPADLNLSNDSAEFTLDDPREAGGAGTGRVELLFPKSYTLEGDLLDRVGPALRDTAVLNISDENRDGDTIICALTEAVTKGLGQDSYCRFSPDSAGTASTQALSSVSLTAGSDSLRLVYSKNSIAGAGVHWVRLREGSDLTDRKGNSPADNSVWIPLKVVGGRVPDHKHAAMYDRDGDGRGDSLGVTLDLGAAPDRFTVDSLTAGRFSWPNTSLGITLDLSQLTGVQENAFGYEIFIDEGAGVGAYELSFPEDFTLTGDVADSVGPAIDSAACSIAEEGRDHDSLDLLLSEELADNFSSDANYIILFDDTTDSDGDTLPVSEVLREGNAYRFLLARGSVSYGDWVQLNSRSDLKDKAGNRPAPYNRKMPITVKGAVKPAILSAAVFDADGPHSRLDGAADSLRIVIDPTDDPRALTADSVQTVAFSWDGQDYTARSFDVNADTITLSRDMTGGAGTGSVTLEFRDDRSVSGSISDSVAPVISSAEYHNWGDRDDTLIVTFTEEVGTTGDDNVFSVDRVPEIAFRVKDRDLSGATATYAVTSADELRFGDSLWIRRGADLKDAEKNEQMSDDNRRVEIAYRRVTAAKEALYRETDSRPDGYIDEVVFTFDADLTDGLVDKAKGAVGLPDERAFSVTGARKEGRRRMVIEVEQDQDKVPAQTAVQGFDKVSLSAVSADTLHVAATELTPRDSLAPVAVAALFKPAKDEKQDVLEDTLRVDFSEEIEPTTVDVPFTLSDGSNGDAAYQPELSTGASGKEKVVFLAEYDQSAVFPANGDSLWVDNLGDISDRSGNEQERDTRPVELLVGKFNPGYTVFIHPGVYDLEEYHRSGGDSLLHLVVQQGRRPLPADISARMKIFDNVGNLLRTFSADRIGAPENGRIYFPFTPENSAGRLLGRGSYYAVINISWTGAEGATMRDSKRILFGIKELVTESETEEEQQ